MNDARLERPKLKDLSADAGAGNRDVLWAILAWGGMKRDAAQRLERNERIWTDIIEKLRSGGWDRRESYRICQDAMLHNPSGGIGPAYFTKLIFFANPRHDGYIMDQWTARSINLLIDRPPLVKMRTRDHVDPRNDSYTYERFCGAVETLSTLLIDKSPEDTEQCLFSTGGRNPAPWRRYVRMHG